MITRGGEDVIRPNGKKTKGRQMTPFYQPERINRGTGFYP
ncbi:hypothetical protein C8D90_102254 [Enterobacillus tribolii]|uniref:Uncharacterized protein n=1 Tax=Enterobacillus tribolii TaxID=1487935 RepID=A0A370R1H3_9GAMM|nr:hypothetical protein C8D90_102254 [Enterobacillus tribolii]